jgi:phosphatidylserine/phosphatidylglycerophosphate/cardiolipin synthase-like enzyme
MRKFALTISLIVVLAVFFSVRSVHAHDLVLRGNVPVMVCFSPHGGCLEAIRQQIVKARSEILVQAYTIGSPVLTQALVDAHKRGVRVQVIIDKSDRQEGLTPPAIMANAGIPVLLDGIHAIANSRVIVIDREVVVTGSFNFNKASEELNAENLLILKSKELAAVYRENWLEHRKHSEPH